MAAYGAIGRSHSASAPNGTPAINGGQARAAATQTYGVQHTITPAYGLIARQVNMQRTTGYPIG